MIHYGDITKIKGAEVPLVDIVTGGSPCQDLSIAGKRQGLAGERSGLFMEQIRIIKELRDESRKKLGTDDPRRIVPRFMVWENVPGAFSSNNGEDFRAVLEETARIADKTATIPRPAEKKGKLQWSTSGCIMGDGWSIAWRVHDAQFWGVPQRRKRIALVADFGGFTAHEILFERKGMSGDIETCGEKGEGAAGDVENGIGETSAVGVLNDQGGSVMNVSENVTGALRAQEHGHQPIVYGMWGVKGFNGWQSVTASMPIIDNGTPPIEATMPPNVVYGIGGYNSKGMLSNNPHSGIYQAETARTLDLNGGNPACNQGGMAVVCLEGNGSRPSHQGDGRHEGEPMYTLNSTEHHAVAVENHPADSRVKISEDGIVQTLSSRMGTGGGNVPMVMETQATEEPYNATTGSFMRFGNSGIAGTLMARDYKDPQIVSYGVDCYNQSQSKEMVKAITSAATDADHIPCTYSNTSVVRRLTPMECERLQGYPDHWTDIGDWVDSKGKKHKGESDSPRYKALGNSIALPFWQWMAERMVRLIKNDEPEKEPTMASLFDGIGGFPLVYSRCGCKPVWCSEIEEFPIAVVKKHFGDDEKGIKGDYEKYL